MTLDHTKDTQKMYMYPDKITFRGHTCSDIYQGKVKAAFDKDGKWRERR